MAQFVDTCMLHDTRSLHWPAAVVRSTDFERANGYFLSFSLFSSNFNRVATCGT